MFVPRCEQVFTFWGRVQQSRFPRAQAQSQSPHSFPYPVKKGTSNPFGCFRVPCGSRRHCGSKTSLLACGWIHNNQIYENFCWFWVVNQKRLLTCDCKVHNLMNSHLNAVFLPAEYYRMHGEEPYCWSHATTLTCRSISLCILVQLLTAGGKRCAVPTQCRGVLNNWPDQRYLTPVTLNNRERILDILTALITGQFHFGLPFTIIQGEAKQVDTISTS